MLAGHHDLYSPESTRAIQIQLYGAPLPFNRDQQGFAYPAQLAVYLLPFALIPDVEVATAAFQGFSLVLLVLALFLFRTKGDITSLYLIPGLILWQFTLLMLFQGQVTPIPLAAISLSWVLFDARKDFFAGIMLSFGLVKPELIIFPLLLILVYALIQRRLKFLWGSLMASGLCLAASVLMVGWWIDDWIQGVVWYSQYAKIVWPIGESWQINPLLVCLIVATIVISIMRTWKNPRLCFAASVPAGILVFPQTMMWGLTMLTIPLMASWQGKTKYAVIAIWLIVWLSILGANIEGWWKVQTTVMPFLCLLSISLAKGSKTVSGDE